MKDRLGIIPFVFVAFLVVGILLYFSGFSPTDFLESLGIDIIGHTYGDPCSGSNGKTGLYGTDGRCWTCVSAGYAVSNPINNGSCSSSAPAGVYCCTGSSGGGSSCNPTGCPSSAPWLCGGKCYANPEDAGYNHNCRKCP
jgi:hypothetical protein